jgi:drug/metabolite transporter (DMT)-like permease
MTSPATRLTPRRVAAAMLTSLPALVILITGIVERRSLPDELPSHWSQTGEVDGTSSTWILFAVTLLIAVVVAGLSIATGIDPVRPSSARPGFFIGGIFSGGAAACWLIVIGITLSTPPNAEPEVGAWPSLILLLAWGVAPVLATFGREKPPKY